MVTVTVVMDLPPSQRFHAATTAAIAHAADALDARVEVRVVPTPVLDADRLDAGVVLGPGTPYREPARAERAIAAARERGLPLVAT